MLAASEIGSFDECTEFLPDAPDKLFFCVRIGSFASNSIELFIVFLTGVSADWCLVSNELKERPSIEALGDIAYIDMQPTTSTKIRNVHIRERER